MQPITKAYVSLITGVLLIGLSPILIKMADAPGIVTSFYRMGIGACALSIPFTINLFNKRSVISLKGIGYAILGGFCFATDMALWSTGIVASNATLPTIVGNLAPLWVGIGAMIFFKEKQRPGFWIGLILALGGVTLLVANDLFESNSLIVKGIFLGLFAGMFYAIYQLFTQVGRKTIDTLTYLFVSTFTSAVVLSILILILKYNFTGYSTETWTLWISMGLGIQAGAWFLINYAQGYIPASVVSPTLLIQPVITALLAISLLNEDLTVWHVGGGVIALTGIYVVHFSKQKQF